MRVPVVSMLTCALLLTGCAALTPEDAAGTSTPALVLQTAAPPDQDAVTTAPRPGTQPDQEQEVDLVQSIPDPDLRAQSLWVLSLMGPGAQGPASEEVEQRFAPEFLEEISLSELGGVFAQLRAGGPYTVGGARQGEGATRSVTMTLETEGSVVMTLALDDQNRIATLFFQPDTSGEEPVLSTWSDLDTVLGELGGQSQVVIGQVTGEGCEVVHTTAGLDSGGEPAPSGSAFKLLVLAAVADAVQAGDLAWEQELRVSPEVKSLPSGVLQERPDGSSVTVQEAAELMISISDNTATDLLMEAVGQRALRAAAETAGLDPVRVMPIPTTRQFFQLGWQVDAQVRTRWAETRVPETREALLADLPEELDTQMAVTEPRWQDRVDWLLTGGEICGLHARLQQQATDPVAGPVRDILALNPGLAPAEGVGYQGFKGGSAPGVLTLSFYVEVDEKADGPGGAAGVHGRVLVIQTRSAEAVDELRAVTIARAGLQHLAGHHD